MKKIVTYIMFFCILFAGCIDERIDDCVSSVIIRGNQIQGAGRAAEEITRFQSGSVISFFSQGGIEADNVYLTYANGIWEHGGALSWNALGKEASFTAFYPCFESGDWKYYDENGFLKDIVYAQGEVSSGRFIELSFRHLFSKIIFEVDEALNEQIQSITFTPSVQVESVQPLTGEVVLTGTSANPFQIEKQSNRMYSFFVPSANEVTIDIQITASEGKQLSLVTTSPQFYQSGYQYTYRLAPEVHEPGIYTVEDFIAFTHLINKMSYPGRTLKEFGETVNGRTTYYLRRDLHFTEETSKEVQPIGANSDYRFGNCFDGLGHTISGLHVVMDDKNSFYGIFSYILENGRIENLNVDDCSYTNATSTQTKYVGMIAGQNYGTVVGCHVHSCKIENNCSGYAGGIVCVNKGSILNCTVNDMQFINAMSVGGLCYDSSLNIINCCVARCSFISNKHAGGLCYNVASGSNLLNCYVYSLDFENTELGALLYKNGGGGLMDCCYYQEDSGLKSIYKSSFNKGTVYTYDSDFTVTDKGCSLLDALNRWVENNQGKYSDYPLEYWQKGDENIPFIHQSVQ